MNRWLKVYSTVIIGYCLITAALPSFVYPQENTDLKFSIQSILLFKFFPYIEWPSLEEEQNSPLVFTVLGNDPFGLSLDELARKNTYKERRIEIRRFQTIADLQPTHVLYIHPSFSNQWEQIQEKTQSWDVLTVSEYEGFSMQGGVFNFFIAEDTVNLEVNVGEAERAGIKISSLLLQLKKVKVIRE